MSEPILIVGAGPTGLALALSLTLHGHRPRLIDLRPGPVQQSRAMVVHARILERYAAMGIADGAVERGTPARAIHVHRDGQDVAELPLGDIGQGMSPFPFLLVLAQDVHEDYLIEQLAARDVPVEWDTSLTDVLHDHTGATATLKTPAGTETVRTPFVIGCEGAPRAVRESLGIAFPGGHTEGLFFVADVDVDEPSEDVHFSVDAHRFVARFPVRTSGTQRLIGVVPDALAGDPDAVTFEDLRADLEAVLDLKTRTVHWFSTYHVSHRVAATFQEGRVFLAGDAGHVHSPVGGQGMNTGIGDALALGWKLAHVLDGRLAADALATYDQERLPFAHRLVATTDRMFGPMVHDDALSRIVRNIAMPTAMRLAPYVPGALPLLFRTISQIGIDYRDSDLAEGSVGSVHGGDRLPWFPGAYDPLQTLDWQLHTFGEPAAAVAETCTTLGLDLVARAFTDQAHHAGYHRDALYLVRPDGYLGWVGRSGQLDDLRAYLDRHGIDPRSRAR